MSLPFLFADATPGKRLLVKAIVASVLLHLAALAVHFSPLDLAKFDRNGPPLEIALVNAKSVSKPTKAELLAQAHLDGGGNTDANRRAKSPLPVLPKESASTGSPRRPKGRHPRAASQRNDGAAQGRGAGRGAATPAERGGGANRSADGHRADAAHAGIDAA